ncbi:MAG: HAD-IIA family hydrolase [Thermomicrobiales bacterium]|jgi:4-nitrophenyl phosphatase|nr:HAD-IIA family hydrolase [Thermomicrobiales bacterium]
MSALSESTVVSNLQRLREAKAFIFDMDGVLYRGHAPLPGVAELFAALELRGIAFRLATNNSTLTPHQYVEKLAGMNIQITADRIVTSGTATRGYLEETLPSGSRVFVIGEPGLFAQIFHGDYLEKADAGEGPVAAVVMGLDREFTYAKLYAAHAAIRNGARFVATNLDTTLPTEVGLVPGCGSIIAAVTAATGQQPEVVGKPEGLLYELAAAQMGVPVTETVAIGDRLDTDIVAAERSGALSVMVLTGVTAREEIVDFPVKPDLVFNDLNAVLDALSS